jgi:hypothetical protein
MCSFPASKADNKAADESTAAYVLKLLVSRAEALLNDGFPGGFPYTVQRFGQFTCTPCACPVHASKLACASLILTTVLIPQL